MRRRLALACALALHLGLLLVFTAPTARAPSLRVPPPPAAAELVYEFAPEPTPPPPAPPMVVQIPVNVPPPVQRTPQPTPAPVDRPPPPLMEPVQAPPTAVTTTEPAETVAPAPAPVAAPIATVATTAPAETAPAPVLTARQQRQAQRAQRTWSQQVLAHLAAHRFYPAAARKDKVEGIVKVRFTVDSAGRLRAQAVLSGTGHPLLDAAALEVLARAEPLPPIPPEMHRQQVTLTVPIDFSLITE